jgi:magnesium transporter
MSSPIIEQLQNAVSQARWNEAVALSQTSDPVQAADALGDLPFEQQQALFRRLPLDLAAAVVAQFPYYHQYVLLHSLPGGEMRALVDKLHPDDRMRLFDELPEEAWQRLIDELSGAVPAETSAPHAPQVARAPEPQLPEPGETII